MKLNDVSGKYGFLKGHKNKKIIFVYRGDENLGIEYLSTMLKKNGYKTELLFDVGILGGSFIYMPTIYKLFNKKEHIIKSIKAKEPKIVCFSVFTDIYQWCLGISNEIKKYSKDTFILWGGIHPTGCPDETIKEKPIDAICIGEGEGAILELVKSIYSGQINYNIENIWFKKDNKIIKNKIRPLVQNLDKLEPQDREIFEPYLNINEIYLTMTGRGCPFRCSYCFSDILTRIYKNEKFLRRRSVESVIQELISANQKYKIKCIYFLDNVFTYDKNWLKEFCSEISKRVQICYTCQANSYYFDAEIARLLKKSGCIKVIFGVQTVNEPIKNKILNRKETNKELDRAFKICDKLGLSYHADHMCGIPGESEVDYIKAVKFYTNRRCLDKINYFTFTYYPGCTVVKYAYEKGLIDRSKLEKINKGLGEPYHRGGSVEDKREKRTNYNFRVFFTLIPILPNFLIAFIIRTRIYKLFFLIPYPVLMFIIGIVVPFIRNDRAVKLMRKQLIKFYIKNIFTCRQYE